MEITSKSEWGMIDWSKIESSVSKLQRRIFRASENGNHALQSKLQKLLVKSQSARLLAVRRISQDNKGKKTAGIDGIKSISSRQRIKLALSLSINGESKPVKRVSMPKPGSKEKRGLGIPTMEERAKQALLKLALEPEWEAKFEENSYGFRPGRSCQDAITAIRIAITYKPKFVLDADIEKCFDQIDHKRLTNKATKISSFKRQIEAWLKAGVVTQNVFAPTTAGVPQGGVISPLLANIALHGMEKAIDEKFPATKGRVIKGARAKFGYLVQKPRLVRYADDFVITCEELSVVKECQVIIQEWLKQWGLNLKESKTRITHTLEAFNGNKPGFDFLGVNIRQYPKGKKHTGSFSNGSVKRQLEYKTLITPSKKSVKKHYKDLSDTVTKFNGKEQSELICALQRKITGWCNYHTPWNSKETFTKLNHLLWLRLHRWGVRRHRDKGTQWIVNKYWKTINGRKWTFTDGDFTLRIHDKHRSGVRHIKVKGTKSPYDGDDSYWNKRMEKDFRTIDPQKSRLIKKQNGRCAKCEELFSPTIDLLEKHHIIARKDGGSNKDSNLEVLHLHCHDKKHAEVAQVIA